MKIKIATVFCLLISSHIALASYYPEVDREVPKKFKGDFQVYVPSLLVGLLAADLNFKISERMTLGPQVSYFSYGKYTGTALGLNANFALSDSIYKDRAWIVNPFLLFTHDNISSKDEDSNRWDRSDHKAKKSGAKIGANLVYQWLWDSGVVMRAGVGLSCSTQKPLFHIGESNVGGSLLFSIGYAF